MSIGFKKDGTFLYNSTTQKKYHLSSELLNTALIIIETHGLFCQYSSSSLGIFVSSLNAGKELVNLRLSSAKGYFFFLQTVERKS